ncbi:ankyrin repeat domain-containing protein [Peribacillus frigoritolerans]|uniref:ankyrin repeat domain-containing protein n=1 Tax=Peribacillus frigoritolerans TaxID=450367 RepID=UPI00105A1520|nr:ankyrin repeat domain-containing protein [Peribacillus frigoritolerans]TDL82741.1 ankyrin repeat domain-containing protein [Peribacillus frigoritolerans]
MDIIFEDEALAVEAVKAIHTGDVRSLKRLLVENPGLVTARIVGRDYDEKCNRLGMSRTLLHVVTDWPGHFLNGAATVRLLIDAGADVNARFTGPHTETPLHWAASCDDIEVLDALLDAGADIEAPGAVIAGGTPLDDAVAFAQWHAARRLVERGAQTKLWHASALGLMDLVKERCEGSKLPAPDEITEAFWLACHGGQLMAAEYLLEQGANLNWIGYDELTPLDTAHRSSADELVHWLGSRGAKSASELG